MSASKKQQQAFASFFAPKKAATAVAATGDKPTDSKSADAAAVKAEPAAAASTPAAAAETSAAVSTPTKAKPTAAKRKAAAIEASSDPLEESKEGASEDAAAPTESDDVDMKEVAAAVTKPLAASAVKGQTMSLFHSPKTAAPASPKVEAAAAAPAPAAKPPAKKPAAKGKAASAKKSAAADADDDDEEVAPQRSAKKRRIVDADDDDAGDDGAAEDAEAAKKKKKDEDEDEVDEVGDWNAHDQLAAAAAASAASSASNEPTFDASAGGVWQKKGGVPAWKRGEPVPFGALADLLSRIEAEGSRLLTVGWLCDFFRSVLALSPSELVDIVYLCTNTIAPAYENTETNVGEGMILKALAGTTGGKPAEVRQTSCCDSAASPALAQMFTHLAFMFLALPPLSCPSFSKPPTAAIWALWLSPVARASPPSAPASRSPAPVC